MIDFSKIRQIDPEASMVDALYDYMHETHGLRLNEEDEYEAWRLIKCLQMSTEVDSLGTAIDLAQMILKEHDAGRVEEKE